jgi:hypothetical protein
MAGASMQSLGVERLLAPEVRNFCVGYIIQVTAEGRALVIYPGISGEPIEARSAVDGPPTGNGDPHEGIPVLLLFENGDPTLPIIIGIIHDTLYPVIPHEEATFSMQRPHDIILDGKKKVLEAEEEIMLRCGKSSLILRKDGKIIVKGTQIVSRAAGTHKIRGASVRIN